MLYGQPLKNPKLGVQVRRQAASVREHPNPSLSSLFALPLPLWHPLLIGELIGMKTSPLGCGRTDVDLSVVDGDERPEVPCVLVVEADEEGVENDSNLSAEEEQQRRLLIPHNSCLTRVHTSQP